MNTKSIAKKLGIAGLTAFVVAIGFFAGLYVNAEKVASQGSGPSQFDMSLFWQAMNTIDSKYVPTASTSAPITDQEKLYGAIKGLAASYGDPYTTFLTPDEAKNLTTDLSGSLEGIGAVLGLKTGALTVISLIPDSPAQKSGLLAGDVIVKVDGKATNGLDIDTAVSLVRGKKGSVVELTVLRDGTPGTKVISITRDTINAPIVTTTQYPGGTYLIKVSSFTSNLPDLFRAALRKYMDSGSKHLIIDLRDNTGGYLDAAVDMASWFLPAGGTVVTEDFAGKQTPVVYRSRGYNLFPSNTKVVILVNEYSASASEIFAGALHDAGKAVLVGKTTYGKGSVQELIPLTSDTLLKVTIARWLTPNGISISHNGIAPDNVVDITGDDVKAGKDPQLDKALDLALHL